MSFVRLAVIIVLPAFTLAQARAILPPSITLPVSFVRGADAAHAKAGDPVEAITLQNVALESTVLPRGSRVHGHVVSANAFTYDHTSYVKQAAGILTVHFDNVVAGGQAIPLRVTVRALAGPIASADSADPPSTDLDPLGTTTQIGGDQVVPSQDEVRDRNGDVVGYNRKDGVYAHLIARAGCDAGSREVSVALFSASACGLYGFGETTAVERGSLTDPSTLTLISIHGSPALWKHSTALLEVLPNDTVASR